MKIKNKFFILVALTVFSCSTQRKVDREKVYSSDYGFTFTVPFSGQWYQGRADFYLFGTKAKKNGTVTLAEVKHGFIYPKKKGKLKVERKTLIEVFEPQFSVKTLDGQIEIKRSHVDYKAAKGTECMFFNQAGVDVETEMKINYVGMICLLPDDGNKYVWMSVSQRIPEDETFENLTKEQIVFFNSLVFKKD